MAPQILCSVADCGKNAVNRRGWCWQHYARWRKHGDPLIKSTNPKKLGLPPAPCSVDGCNKPNRGHGLCSTHYSRQRRHGTTDNTGFTSRGEPLQWLQSHINHDGNDCLIWPFARGGTRGDGVVSFRGKQTSANYAMCILAHGEPPTPKHESAHSCGRGHDACVHPNHLRWATRKENLADRLIHGTMPRGEQSPVSKLTISEVRQIRALRGSKGQKEIAAMFGVSVASVSVIQLRKNWAWLP